MTDPIENKADTPEFTPVPKKYYRHDGWTPQRQRAFIAALSACGSVTEAARHVGMSHGTAYRLRHDPGAEEFAAAWDAALAKATNRIHDVLVDHAINGAPEPIMYGGEQVGEFRRHNYRMMMWLLRHHQSEKFSGAMDGEGDGALTSPRLTNPRLRRLKDQWRAEWEAEKEAERKEMLTNCSLEQKLKQVNVRLREYQRQRAAGEIEPYGWKKEED